MIIIIAMGGKGSRFKDAGYEINKACIPTTDRHTGEKLPMIICAMKDIPDINNVNNKIICVDTILHKENGTEKIIKSYFPNVTFIRDYIQLDQAWGVMCAHKILRDNPNEEVMIWACDSGINIDIEKFACTKKDLDAIMISHSNDENIERNPYAHSWAELEENGKTIKKISVKQPVSDTPMQDHATTGFFYFKKAGELAGFLLNMILDNNPEEENIYIDGLLQYYINAGKRVGFHDVDYFCWGTPSDYELYEKTINYWKSFSKKIEI